MSLSLFCSSKARVEKEMKGHVGCSSQAGLLVARLNQTRLLSYAVFNLQKDLGLPVVQLGELVKLNNTSCKLADITVIYSCQDALKNTWVKQHSHPDE